MRLVVLIMCAGAAGVGIRYGAGQLLAARAPDTFPWATLLVNTLGCLAIGALVLWVRGDAWAIVAIGLLGGLTTFSSLALETVALAQAGRPGTAAAYVLATNMLGVLAVLAGMSASRAFSA